MSEQRVLLRVLHIEDSDDDALLVTGVLRRAGYDVHAQRVMTPASMQAALQNASWDVVLADYSLPSFDAPAALAILKESGLDLPFIIISGTIDEVQAVTALRAGAHDFVTKGQLARLVPAIEREMRDAENRRQRRQIEVRLKTTMDAMLEGAQIIGRDWRYLYVNNAAAAHGHTTQEALVGRTMMEVYPGIEQTELFSALRRCMEERAPQRLENEFVYPDGSATWFDLNIQPVPEGLFILSHDITERKRADAALRESEERTRRIIATALDAVVTIDSRSVITSWNAQAEIIFGWSHQEAIGQFIYELIIPGPYREAHRRGMEHFLATGDGPVLNKRIEISALHRAGHEFPVELAISPVKTGDSYTYSAFVRDITEQKRADARIKSQLERLAALRTIDLAITSSLDLRLTLSIFLDQVITQLGVDAADVLLIDSSDGLLTYTAGRGFRSTSFQQARVRLGEGRAGRAALERRLVSESAPSQERPASRRTGLLGGEKFVSYYGMPLIAKGQVVGVLELFHRALLQPAPEWLEFLEALAGQAAIAIENALLFDGLQRSNQSLILAYDATIEGWSRALDLRDRETEGHSQRVTETTLRLAEAFNMGPENLVHVRRGSLLHDIGKMGIPDQILLKPGPLTDDEWVIMRQHPTFAYDLLAPISFLRPALDIPYCHHEKWDGSGYPRGLSGEQIPLAARLFAVVDVWDALRSDRPYRPAWPAERVLEYVRSLAGSHFDPRAVEVFLRIGS